ncbi:MAG: Holliday junction resolvase RuvX [Nitrospirae bacterium]|nr:Holliday junction resolvase RuvX [Nitrospirota bacterium]
MPTVPKILALDVGDVRIGVAVSDALGIAAHPVRTVRRTRPERDLDAVLQAAAEQGVARILVGLPRMLNNTLGVQAEKVQAFVESLRERTALPVTLWDERLSTVAAERALIQSGLTRERRRKVVDQVAAIYFLQGYLDYLAAGGNPDGPPD